MALVLLYALSAWVVYRIGRKLLQNDLAAFAGALLWAVLPLHVEVVAWVASMSDIGCTLFSLLGFWMFLWAEERAPANFRWHVVAAAIYFPALFFKEIAFSFPLILLAYWFCHPSAEPWTRRALRWLPYVAAGALCAIIRVSVMGQFAQTAPVRGFSWRVPWAAVGLLGQHSKLFLWPVNLSEFRDFNLAASLRSPWPWLALAMVAAAALFRRRNSLLSFLALWWFAALLPCLNYRQLTVPLVADRFSYFASVGLCLALGYLACAWAPQHFPKGGYAAIGASALAVVAGLWAAQTVAVIPHWRSNDEMFDYSLRASPETAELHVNHGAVLQLRDNDLNGAALEFRTALRLNEQSFQPSSKVTYNAFLGLGQVALNQGREPEALDYFNRAMHLMPNESFAYNVLGSIYFPRGDYGRAATYFQQAVQRNLQETESRFYLGTCWMKMGKPEQAAGEFRAAREIYPDYSQAYAAEARALDAAGDATGAATVRRLMAGR